LEKVAAISSHFSGVLVVRCSRRCGRRRPCRWRLRAEAGVVDRELLEIGDDAEREFGGEGIDAELVGGLGVVLQDDRGFLGLDEKFASAADAEGVVGSLYADTRNAEGILVDHVLVGLGVALFVAHIPTERGKERIDEFLADLSLLVVGIEVGIEVAPEGGDAVENARGNRHGDEPSRVQAADRRKPGDERFILWRLLTYGRDPPSPSLRRGRRPCHFTPS
jgi:hypothetical protein